MGLLTELFLSRLKLPRDIHRFAFRKYAGRVALRFPDKAITFAELQDRSYRLVQALEAAGLKTGDNLFVQVEPGPEFFEIRTAALEIGLVLTVFHSHHSREFVAFAARKASPKLMICDPLYASGAPDVPHWITGDSYETELANHKPAPSKARFSPDLPMGLGFTSGTTGAPKGLLSSHGAAIASLKLIIRNLKIKPDRKAINVSLPAIPLVGAGSGPIFPSLLSGGELVVADVPDARTLVALVKAHGVTRIFITPSQLIDLLELPESADADLASLKHIIYGTSNMPLPKLEEAIRRFGPIFQQGYGQAEVLPPVSLLSPEDHMQNGAPAPRNILRSCGRVLKGVSVRIVEVAGAAKMFVSLRAGHEDAGNIGAEVRALIEKSAEPCQISQEISIISEIPRSFLGKVLRKNVREKMNHVHAS